MPMITTADGTDIFYKDWGPRDAQPIVFHHGWPLSSDDWDSQMLFFYNQGFRVVAHDQFTLEFAVQCHAQGCQQGERQQGEDQRQAQGQRVVAAAVHGWVSKR